MLFFCSSSMLFICMFFIWLCVAFAVIEHNISILTSFESFEEEQAREEHIYMFSNAAGMPGTLEEENTHKHWCKWVQGHEFFLSRMGHATLIFQAKFLSRDLYREVNQLHSFLSAFFDRKKRNVHAQFSLLRPEIEIYAYFLQEWPGWKMEENV